MKNFKYSCKTIGNAILFACTLVIGTGSIMPEPAAFNGWSSYQGWMTWGDAKDKCNSIGMRLPTIEELKAAYAKGELDSWKNDTGYYWSSTPGGAGIYCLQSVRLGGVCYGLPDDKAGVRCRR